MMPLAQLRASWKELPSSLQAHLLLLVQLLLSQPLELQVQMVQKLLLLAVPSEHQPFGGVFGPSIFGGVLGPSITGGGFRAFKWMKQQFEEEQVDLINVGTDWQTADILTKPFTSPPKWEHALRLMSIGKTWIQADDKTKVRQVDPKSACPANANNQGGNNSSNSFQRMLIEFCCLNDSKLCTPREASKGCRLIRVTEKEDGSTPGCRKWLAQEVQSFRENNPEGEVLLYASLPCVGGSPWGYINRLTDSGAERIEQQQEEFTKLFKSLQKVINEIDGPHLSIAFELSKNCKYWKWPMVQSFLKKQELKLYPFHGCQFGVTDFEGNPMK